MSGSTPTSTTGVGVSSVTRVVALTGSGASFSPMTVTVMVSTTVFSPSVVVTWKVISVSLATLGDSKVGSSAYGSDRVTAGPETCTHSWVRGRPSGSLAVADSCTVVSSATLKSGPASRVGASLSAFTRMTTVSTAVCSPSETSTSKVTKVLVTRSGAVKVAVGLPASLIVTAGPPVWRQL